MAHPPDPPDTLLSVGDTVQGAHTAAHCGLQMVMEVKIAADAGSCCTASTPVDASDGVDTAPKSTCTHPPDRADTMHSSGGTAEDAHTGAYCDLYLDLELKLVADTAFCWTTSTPVDTSDGVDTTPTSTSTHSPDPPHTLNANQAPGHVELVVEFQERITEQEERAPAP